MNILDIQTLSTRSGRCVVPAPDEYDRSSAGWAEAEHHAELPGSDSLAAYWTGEPGWVDIDDWPYHEVCVILAGRVAVIDDEGGRVEFGRGESFVVPKGFCGRWETIEPTEKIFVGIAVAG